MTALAEYTTQRTTAGTRYANALSELFDALVDLAALDRTMENSRAGGRIPQKSFVGDLQGLLIALEHPVFAPRVSRRLADEISAATAQYVAAIS